MLTKKSLTPAIKISLVFFILALIIQVLLDLSQKNWDFSLLAVKVDTLTLMIPLVVLAFQFIITTATDEINLSTHKINNLVEELPDIVQKGTQKEINSLKVDNEKFREQIAKGVVEYNHSTYRTLVYKDEEGSLFNGYGDSKDTSRNVLFNNKTINLIFRFVMDINPDNRKLLHNMGKTTSKRFAAEMVRNIEKKYPSSTSDLTDWLSKWIEFDSDAGFGLFALEGDKENWIESKVILLKYSFLTQDYMEGNANNSGLCGFMTGYLEGIINSFPHKVLAKYGFKPGEIIVEHDTTNPEDCICAMRPESEGCRYHLRTCSRSIQ